MKMRSKTAFGIDICKNAVSFAELQRNGQQIKVVRAGCAPLDQAIVNDGIVQDPAALAGILKQFKIAGSLKHGNAVLTICAEPVLLQILNLPDSSPGKAIKFIQNEVRQYAVLPLKNIEIDYCGLKSSDTQTKRVLVGAAQTEHLSMTVKAIAKDNINVSAIEPAVTAFIRICYDRIIKPQKEKNVMLLLVRDDTLNLCVFEKQRLEFLRIKKFEADIAASQQRSSWLRYEIESVIQFHELEKETKAQSWQIFVVCCPENKYSAQIVGEIKSQTLRQDVEIAAFENSLMDMVIDGNDNKEVPPVAAGAAMKLLDGDRNAIKLNLLPKEIVSVRKARKEMLIIANVAVCLLILLFLHIALLNKKSINVSHDIYTKKQKQLNVNMLKLVESRKDISEKVKLAKDNLAVVRQVVEDRSYHNWAKLLAELASAVPQTVLIQNLQGKGDNAMKIDGLAVSFEAVSNFVDLLGQSKEISSASLTSAGQNTKFGNGLIDYSIVCSLRQYKE
jgi:Tfp pilus assembly PilM family ATPase/Tfp pilus assembly protein PilN